MSLEAPPPPPPGANPHGEVTVNRSLFCFPANNSASTSSGIFAGDDPLKFYFPLLLYHVCIVFFLSRVIHALLRRSNVPLVISQILAGAFLGPSFLGKVFPNAGKLFASPEGWVQINTVGGYAFMLQIFTVGVKTDLGMIVKSGRKAVAIAFFGTAGPHLAMLAAGAALRSRVPATWKATFMLTNLNSWWSLSAFIVVCSTLDDLNLLSSKLGRLAMSAALVGDFANTFSIAGVTSYLLASSPSEKIHRIGILSLITFSVFIVSMAFVARPAILRIIRDVPEGALLGEARLVGVLLIAVACTLAGEFLGLHATYGPFMLGLMLPGGAPLGVTLDERLDRLVAGVLMPLLFAQGGVRLDVFKLADASTCLLLEVFIVVGAVAKFVSCFFVHQQAPGSASLQPFVCIAPYATMHDDVCAVALDKGATLIVVPFHKRLAIDGSVENTTANAGDVKAANLNVLSYSPCSVAFFVDRGSLSVVSTGSVAAAVAVDADGFFFPHRVAMYFLGGADGREALALAAYMAEDAAIGLTVFRFVLLPEWRRKGGGGGDAKEDRLDDEVVQEYVQRWVDDRRLLYSENEVRGSDELVAVIRKASPAADLLIVGRRAECPESPMTAGISDWSEHLELGVLGDLLTSTDFGCRVSTLVVQQQTKAAAGEIGRSPEKTMRLKDTEITN
ncbi:hypothetical protein HU200_028480 [Digitaria exilis]|uniref:Cation/H+ exchanger domain-containing protein n=1 Tax=Digitaria exilis TaxID=1010633 RepID=A0A835BZW0_9POAL|nr:hypothetical protein HU200_028480 [Digitaria exilis]